MSLIEGIGDEVTHFFVGLFVVIVVTLAWWTTNISEQRHVRTVLLLERRRNRTQRRLTNHTEAVTITDGTSHLTPVSEERSIDTVTSQGSCNVDNQQEVPTTSTESCNVGQSSRGEENIIESMDNDATILRQRRVAFYNNWNNDSQDSPTRVPSKSHTVSSSNDLPTSPVPDQVDNQIVMEHNYAEYPSSSNSAYLEIKNTETTSELNDEVENHETNVGITIKLKYINDDLKSVDGKLDELLGDFKKRHFQLELSANKLVRLIFNGQVLQPDTQTLASCGLFDNCVVHCLIHQKRSQTTEPTVHESRREGYSFPNQNGTQNLNNNREWDLGNFLFAFISFILLAAWYFRYVYAHLYTVTATVGLILITGIFTIVLVGMYFPDNEPMPNPTIRIARERVQPQQ